MSWTGGPAMQQHDMVQRKTIIYKYFSFATVTVCVFHANWTVVPDQAGHLFQAKLDTVGVTAWG